jgi:hypothetical protein
MTLVSSIITDAYRESNLIPLSATANANQIAEALRRLNNIVLSTVGYEAGEELNDLTIGGDYDQSTELGDYLPANIRLMLNLTAAKAYDLDPEPYEGQRLAIADVTGNLATYNVVLSGNGRLIEGATSLTLNTDDLTRQWMYRSDTGNWVRIDELVSSDHLPFPSEFDDYFITMLAMRLNPRYGQAVSGETTVALRRSRNQIRARYRNTKDEYPEYMGRLATAKYYFFGSNRWNR